MKHQLEALDYGRGSKTSVERTQDLQSYYAMIANFKTLTIDDEVELADKVKRGDKKAKETLVNCNLRAVVSIAKQYAYCGGCLNIMDLINEGNIGLIEAVDMYDSTYGIKFMSYAVARIRAHIIDALNKKSRIVSDYHGNTTNRHSSLDAPLDDDNDTTLGDLLCTTTDAESFANENLFNDIMRSLNAILKPNEVTIICTLYGIGTTRQCRWELAEHLGKTEERIRQVEQEIIKKLKTNKRVVALLVKYI